MLNKSQMNLFPFGPDDSATYPAGDVRYIYADDNTSAGIIVSYILSTVTAGEAWLCGQDKVDKGAGLVLSRTNVKGMSGLFYSGITYYLPSVAKELIRKLKPWHCDNINARREAKAYQYNDILDAIMTDVSKVSCKQSRVVLLDAKQVVCSDIVEFHRLLKDLAKKYSLAIFIVFNKDERASLDVDGSLNLKSLEPCPGIGWDVSKKLQGLSRYYIVNFNGKGGGCSSSEVYIRWDTTDKKFTITKYDKERPSADIRIKPKHVLNSDYWLVRCLKKKMLLNQPVSEQYIIGYLEDTFGSILESELKAALKAACVIRFRITNTPFQVLKRLK